jgi:hypothetical protein
LVTGPQERRILPPWSVSLVGPTRYCCSARAPAPPTAIGLHRQRVSWRPGSDLPLPTLAPSDMCIGRLGACTARPACCPACVGPPPFFPPQCDPGREQFGCQRSPRFWSVSWSLAVSHEWCSACSAACGLPLPSSRPAVFFRPDFCPHGDFMASACSAAATCAMPEFSAHGELVLVLEGFWGR